MDVNSMLDDDYVPCPFSTILHYVLDIGEIDWEAWDEKKLK